jgi:hypothetical protein
MKSSTKALMGKLVAVIYQDETDSSNYPTRKTVAN